MKIKTFLLTVAAAISISCETDKPYNDTHASSKEEDMYKIVQTDLISSSFRIIELAEVFSIYQGLRSNREVALSHVEKYFGTSNSVYYEYMSIYEWGTIHLLADGSCTAKPSNWKSYWIASNSPREVHIEMPQEHHYIAASTSDKAIWDIEATVEDSRTITISGLHAKVSNDDFGTAEVELLEALRMPMCRNGQRKLEPTDGKIIIRYTSKESSATFQVEYHETGKTFTLEDNTTMEVGPEPAYRNEY